MSLAQLLEPGTKREWLEPWEKVSQYDLETTLHLLAVTFLLAFQETVSGGEGAPQRRRRVDLLSFSVSKPALSFSKLL